MAVSIQRCTKGEDNSRETRTSVFPANYTINGKKCFFQYGKWTPEA
jgi:hypothetical protein